MQVLAREAELRMLRAQIDPHFLFNCLHSISALTASNAAAARQMCVLLADFLRESLALGSEDRITLARELALVERFLAVERVRFGDRLAGRDRGAGEAGYCLVPPLLLQPLVENAVTHGIAHMLDGGHGERRPPRASAAGCRSRRESVRSRPAAAAPAAGVGLANVRARLTALHGADARFTAGESDGIWRVEMSCRPQTMADGRAEPRRRRRRPELRASRHDRAPACRDRRRRAAGARGGARVSVGAIPASRSWPSARNGFEAVKAVSELSPDLLFLDVQMPKLSGFEVLELLGREVPVIFTTAYDQYALRAFEVHAVDYLLKPFSEERFAEALSRARERLPAARRARRRRRRARWPTRARAKGPLERVLIRDGAQVHVLPVERIDYVEAQDDYVCFTADGTAVPEGSDAGGAGGAARSGALRPHPPVVSAQHRADRAGRAVREGQPGGDPARRPAAAGQPRRLREAREAALVPGTVIAGTSPGARRPRARREE